MQCSGRTEGAQVVQHHLSGGSKEPGMATNPKSFRVFCMQWPYYEFALHVNFPQKIVQAIKCNNSRETEEVIHFPTTNQIEVCNVLFLSVASLSKTSKARFYVEMTPFMCFQSLCVFILVSLISVKGHFRVNWLKKGVMNYFDFLWGRISCFQPSLYYLQRLQQKLPDMCA